MISEPGLSVAPAPRLFATGSTAGRDQVKLPAAAIRPALTDAMRIAILTDLHANREAVSACLAHAQRKLADRYVFLGDYVGYGADPGWVIDTVIDHVQRGAVAVLGNHDSALTSGARASMNNEARISIEWASAQISTAQLEFLAALPLQVHEDDRLYVHANAWQPGEWEYVHSQYFAARSMRATHCRYTFCGHIHEPMLYHMAEGFRVSGFLPVAGTPIPVGRQRRWLAIPGAVGQPRDGNPAACYAMFDDELAELTFHRVPYDVETAARKVIEAGLPPRLGERLAMGF